MSNSEDFDREFKILVVDAERDSRSEIRRVLQASHYAVITAENAPEAVQLALTIKPDLILINAGSSLKGPVELLDQLKNNPLTSNVPLIFLMEGKDRPNIDIAVELGVMDWVESPYRPKELLGRIRRALIGRYGRKRVYDRFRQFQSRVLDLVSSQIRTHITVISGLAELMEKRFKSSEEKTQMSHIQGILLSAKDLNGLMDDIESMFHSNDRYEEINLLDLVQSELIKFRELLETKKQQLVLDFPRESGIQIIGNRPFISAALRQIILNVHRYTNKEGSIRVQVTKDSLNVRIEVEDGRLLRMERQSNSDPEKVEWRPADITGDEGTPTSLVVAGLIVEQHDGCLLMAKPIGTGGGFRVELPLSGQPIDPRASEIDLNHQEVGPSRGWA